MFTGTSRVRAFNEADDHDSGGNRKKNKWKELLEKHKDDLRKLWDNKEKWQKLVLEVHIKRAKRFAYTMYLLMVCITLIYYGARFLSNGSIDLYMFLPVLLLQIMAVTWSRLLVLGKQIKCHTYIMVGILNMSIFWGPIIYDFCYHRTFHLYVHGLFLGILCPIFGMFAGRVMINVAEALRYQHDNELPLLASQLSIKFLGGK